MKILVLSDSHGNTEAVQTAFEKENPDVVLHLGDYARDAEGITSVPVYKVEGNCDRPDGSPEILNIVLDGVRFFLTHGHIFNVKYDTASYATHCLYRDVKVALYGHTHIPDAKMFGDMLLLNPGTCGRGQKTYAVLDTEHGVVKYEFKKL